MRVVIAGASGLIGQELLDLCLGDKTIDDVYILVRKPLEIKHEKLTQTLVNYDALAENVIPEKVDVLFNCLGTTIKNAGSEEAFTKVDFTYVSKIATLAHKKGVDKLISISSMGADIHSKTLYYRVKGMKEDCLMNDCGIDNVFIVRPSLLLGNRKEFRLGEEIGKVFMRLFNLFFLGSLKQYKAIPAITVAQAMLNLTKINESGKKIILNEGLKTIAEATI